MGGFGSGYQSWQHPKEVVENCLTLSVSHLGSGLTPGRAGRFTWPGGAAVGFSVAQEDDERILRLSYHLTPSGQPMVLRIRLQATQPHYGGRRWWFTCPLVVAGRPCRRRVGKLYLPPGCRWFGCRECYELTYRSCQEAHRDERDAAVIFKEIGCLLDIERLLARKCD